MKRENNKNKKISQTKINIMILLIMLMGFAVMIHSSIRLGQAMDAEDKAVECKEKSHELGDTLCGVSDYLTEECRSFVITDQKTYMDNYWNEVNKTKRRENVIEKLNGLDLLDEENWLLSMGKKKSDELICQEALAIRYEAESHGLTVLSDIITLTEDTYTDNLSSQEKHRMAVELLFSEDYSNKKEIIHGYVSDFQNLIDLRMSRELKAAKKETEKAMQIMNLTLLIVTILSAFVVIMVIVLIINPILSYSKWIEKETENILIPRGTKEIYNLGYAIKEMYENMNQALQTKSKYLAVMSHEIRTPLHSMSGYTYLLRNSQLDFQQKEYVEYLDKSANNLLMIVNNILNYEKLEKNKAVIVNEEFNVLRLMEEVKSAFSIQCRRKAIELNIDYVGENNSLEQRYISDYMKLKQLLNNIVGNAVKFTPKGCINVDFSITDIDKIQEKCILHIRVSDTGIGIKKESINKIFESYEQANGSITRDYGGTGLGLPICRDIVKLLGGQIQVESEYLKGTTFDIEIPVQCGEMKAIKNREENKEDTQLKYQYSRKEKNALIVTINVMEGQNKINDIAWEKLKNEFSELINDGDFQAAEFFKRHKKEFEQNLGADNTLFIENKIENFEYQELWEYYGDMFGGL